MEPQPQPQLPPAPSQASSHISLEPIAASVLADVESRRRDALRENGCSCRSGCPQLDDYVLLGGFERGCVVGVSAEEEDTGLLLALQVLAHSVCSGHIRTAMVVTPKPAAILAAALRRAISVALADLDVPPNHVQSRLKECLDNVMLSCVFDFDGLWEVLYELDQPLSAEQVQTKDREAETEAVSQPQRLRPLEGATAVAEIPDSEDEDGYEYDDDHNSTPPSGAREAGMKETVGHEGRENRRPSPEIIVVTHFSSLLIGLFTQRQKSAAHSALQLLNSHLRHLSRSLESQPLIMLLNSTTSSDTATSSEGEPSMPKQQQQRRGGGDGRHNAIDPVLRSIFNPAPLALPGYAYAGASRRNKPSFGLVFTQLLDLSLLATLLPRSKADADAIFAPNPSSNAALEEQRQHQRAPPSEVKYVTVVEVLMDDMGVWAAGSRGVRRHREQRWAPVDVKDGRVVNAFAADPGRERGDYKGEVRVVAGFGGPRV